MEALLLFFPIFSLYANSFFSFFKNLQLSGFKKVINYTKKVMEDIRYRKRVSREEVMSGYS